MRYQLAYFLANKFSQKWAKSVALEYIEKVKNYLSEEMVYGIVELELTRFAYLSSFSKSFMSALKSAYDKAIEYAYNKGLYDYQEITKDESVYEVFETEMYKALKDRLEQDVKKDLVYNRIVEALIKTHLPEEGYTVFFSSLEDLIEEIERVKEIENTLKANKEISPEI